MFALVFYGSLNLHSVAEAILSFLTVLEKEKNPFDFDTEEVLMSVLSYEQYDPYCNVIPFNLRLSLVKFGFALV